MDMDCLHCTWQQATDLHGTEAHYPTFRIALRVGIVTTETTGEPVIALTTYDQDPLAITTDVATRLIDALRECITQHDKLTAERESKQRETARRLVQAAVLTQTQWRAVLDGLASGNAKQREAAIAALTDAAPPRWPRPDTTASKDSRRTEP